MKRPAHGGLRRGFSLIELAIVILALTILFAILFGTYYAAARISKETSPRSEARSRTLLALNLVQTSINQTFFLEGVERLIFVGRHHGSAGHESDLITFATVVPGAESTGVPAVREVSYYLVRSKEDPSGPGTLYRREDQNVDQDPYKGGFHYRLLENVQSFQLKYSLNGKDWLDSWNSADTHRFPRLVRIEIVVKEGDRTERFESLASPGLFQY